MSTATATKTKPEPEQKVTVEQKQKQSLATFRAGDHYTINISKVDRNARNSVDPVQVIVNGILYLVKRGANVVVPAPVVGVLRDARETTYEQVGEGREAQVIATEVQSYPFQILAGPHPRDESPVPGAAVAGREAKAA